MKKFYCIIFIVGIVLTFGYLSAYAETYPEFTGNYIKCGSEWCPLEVIQLNVMALQEFEDGGWRSVTYSGFFTIPQEAFKTKDKKPRILFYSGKSQVDPSYTALVKLKKLPYNNVNVFSVDGTDYNNNVRYTKENVKHELWTFGEEIEMRSKPIEGKTGMFLYEPAKPLADGLYAVDFGKPKPGGHENLSVGRFVWGAYQEYKVITALPFVVGTVNDKTSENKKNNNSDQANKQPIQDNSETKKEDAENLGKNIGDAIFKGLFGK